MARDVHVIDHPLVQHKLTLMRDKDASHSRFRALASELGALLAYEMTRELVTHPVTVETPLGTAQGVQFDGKKLVLVAVLRAGLGVLAGMLDVLPPACVGHMGLYRDRRLKTAVEYYLKLPDNMAERDAVVVCSLLATGSTAVAAAHRVLESGARSVRFVCLVASPQGIAEFHDEHPEVPIYTAAVDEGLNERGFIVPGLGDVGDRLYATE